MTIKKRRIMPSLAFVLLTVGICFGIIGCGRPKTSPETTIPPFVRASAGDDEFSSGTLGSQWSWIRQDAANWSLTARSGYMRIICTSTDIYGASNSGKNILLQNDPAGDWSIVTRLDGKPSSNWAQAGLIVYQNDDNYVKLARLYDSANGGNVFQLTKEAGASPVSSYAADNIASTVSYLKITKSGNNYSGYYSADGVTYTQVGSAQTITLSPLKVGLLCIAGTGLNADFDYFHILTSGPSGQSMEAENMTLTNYTVEANAISSGGNCIKCNTGTTGTATYTFTGSTGTYDLMTYYFDENDGACTFRLYVAGVQVDSWVANQNLGSANPDALTYTNRTKAGVTINNGDQIKLEAVQNSQEFGRYDKIEITASGPAPTLTPTPTPTPTSTPTPTPTGPSGQSMEAENMTRTNYVINTNTSASNGNLIKLSAAGVTGTATYTFSGATGTYDIKAYYYDENDGACTFRIYVAGNQVDSWTANQNLGSADPVAQTRTSRTKAGVSIANGAQIKLEAIQNAEEWGRFDRVEITVPGANPTPTPTPTSTPTPAGWVLTWSDEFNGTGAPDPAKWDRPEYNRRNNPNGPDGWWEQDDSYLDGAGNLVIRVRRVADRNGDGDPYDYNVGAVRTAGKFTQRYGKFEVRAQMPQMQGWWVAFWMMQGNQGSIGNGGVDGSEVDIMEGWGWTDKINHAIHWDGYGASHQSTGHNEYISGIRSGWHTFTLIWDPDMYYFYIDGVEQWRSTGGGVCNQPGYIKITGELSTEAWAITDSWSRNPAGVAYPDYFKVDYCRVYQRQ